MDCKDTEKLLFEYIDRGLPPPNKDCLEEHLQKCERCREQAQNLAECRGKLKQVLNIATGKVGPPLGMLERIRRRAGIESEKAPPKILGIRPVLAGIILSFASVFLMLFAFVPFLGGGARPPAAPPAIVSDGTGGAYLYWHTGGREYEQHIDAEGNLLWGGNGRDITGKWPSFDTSGGMTNAQDSTNYSARVGSIRFWYDSGTKKVYIQDPDADDQHAWLRQRNEVYPNPAFKTIGYSNITTDGTGGVIITSRASNGGRIYSTYDVYAVRIDGSGNWVWGESGILVQRASSAPTVPIAAGFSIVIGGLLALMAWRGKRLSKMFIPLFSLGLFYIGLFCIFMMHMTSVGIFSSSWQFILDTPLNVVFIWVMFITGLSMAIIGIRKARVNARLMVPVILPYLILAGLVILFIVS